MSLLTAHRKGFGQGFTPITTLDDPSGIALGVLKLTDNETMDVTLQRETAWLLVSGLLDDGDEALVYGRGSLFDGGPVAWHGGKGSVLGLRAHRPTELLVFETANTRPFEIECYDHVGDEHRGKGKVHDGAFRFVRTVFDGSNAPPEAELVLGEVVNLPGRWSSYPPHHHPQPELYHYRFDRPEGFGHAELGEDVFKVKSFDTLRIMNGLDHPHCAAPGYAMWYAWVIRHLPGARYGVPDFAPAHKWTMEEGAEGWWPRGVDEP